MSANPEVFNRLPDVKAQKGLATNPGKTGEMFDKEHPYFPKDCAHCFLRKGGKIKNMFSNEGKHCLSCQYSTDCTNRAKEIAKWLEKETPTVAEKEAIYAMPIEQQYVSEDKFKKGSVYRHLFAGKEDDYANVLDVARAFAEKYGDCKINPRVNAKSVEGRRKIYPGIQSKCTPGLYIEGIGYVDVKSPLEFSNITGNAIHASKAQESYACITTHNFDITTKGIATKVQEIFNDKNYKHDIVYWLIDGVLHEYKRPKK